MPKINYKKMYEELEKTCPEALTPQGIVLNNKTARIMEKYGYIQKQKDREEAIDYNKKLFNRFKYFVKKQNHTEKWKYNIIEDIHIYMDLNHVSAYALRFDQMDEEHFNYLLFNRCIRKASMTKTHYLSILRSIGVLGQFMKQQKIPNWKLFKHISKQKQKMLTRIGEYHKILDAVDKGELSEEEFGEKTIELFGYGYFE